MATKKSADMNLVAVTAAIASEIGANPKQVAAAIELLQDGNTIPFIARYRKEVTGGLDEIALRAIEDLLEKATALAARKATVLNTIDGLGLLTAALSKQIESCEDLTTLEAIYLPFKPKRRTRATIAKERGLQPLADLLLSQKKIGQSKNDVLAKFIDAAKEVPDAEAALQGAMDIVAEAWSEDVEIKTWMNDQASRHGRITSQVKRGKKDAAAEKFELYTDHQESASRIPSHRLLAMLRGEAEGMLKVGVALDDDDMLRRVKPKLIHNRDFEFHDALVKAAEDCYTRLLLPATGNTVLQSLKEKADEEAINVFGKNLRELLMAAPAGPRVTIGIDPGFRTGCKVAVIDATGKYLANRTIYPTAPKNDTEGASKTLMEMIQKHGVELIAIGNGTASRETDAFVGEVIKKNKLPITKVMVSEAGASIYSASELAGKEFPDLDITVRGAISIARRLQDPLAELVKSDPKSIGVGQYQHDVNQTKLRKCLDRTVESCVNQVGVDLNMASVPLLSHVAGIGPKLAENIVEYRDANGRFRNRSELTKVAKLGKKAFEQAAGFLRIRGGDQPLDESAVHPECYSVVSTMAKKLGADAKSLVGNATLSQKIRPEDFVNDRFGVPTITDIISELAKPGRDPRSEFRAVKFDDKVNDMKDLKNGMILEGVITNVTHFGAFVDLGVHQDGLIHISQLADKYVSDPSDVVAVGDVVKVKVMEVDMARKRIAVTRKF
ncbi:Tex family protein [Rubripirellula reticaptiva]|uniref:30S ribosomal protein S1 n=1 Tax=Rubripirellula reticaptiva TaxID=2528013 RepID=A0A5C6ELB3_9BACT|nr:Tex family protein [Rubripirellula reticaptiva]TWU49628.1 30S ribosomal protein S1 [Rubripirellula reticaptiva]